MSITVSNMTHTEVDSEGRQIIRTAAGKLGWTYFCDSIEFQTAKLNSLYHKTEDGTDQNCTSIKFYDVNDDEITDVQDETSITKTVLIFKPAYDYELIAGSLFQVERPTTDLRIWASGGILELGGAYVKTFAGALNMHFVGADEQLKTDGRAAKYMVKDIAGVPYQANQIKILVKHDAGVQHKLMINLEYFRA